MGNQKSRDYGSPDQKRNIDNSYLSRSQQPYQTNNNMTALTNSIKNKSDFQTSKILWKTFATNEEMNQDSAKTVMTGSVYLRMPQSERDKLEKLSTITELDYQPIVLPPREMYDQKLINYKKKISHEDCLDSVTEGLSFCSAFTLVNIQFATNQLISLPITSFQLISDDDRDKNQLKTQLDVFIKDYRLQVKHLQDDFPFLPLESIKKKGPINQKQQQKEYVPKTLAHEPPPPAPTQKQPHVEYGQEVFVSNEPQFVPIPLRQARKTFNKNQSQFELGLDVVYEQKQQSGASPQLEKPIIPPTSSEIKNKNQIADEDTASYQPALTEFQFGDTRNIAKNRISRLSVKKNNQNFQSRPYQPIEFNKLEKLESIIQMQDFKLKTDTDTQIQEERQAPYVPEFQTLKNSDHIPNEFDDLQYSNFNFEPKYLAQSQYSNDDRQSIYKKPPTPVNPEVHPLMMNSGIKSIYNSSGSFVNNNNYNQFGSPLYPIYSNDPQSQSQYFNPHLAQSQIENKEIQILEPYKGPIKMSQHELQYSQIKNPPNKLLIIDSPPETQRKILAKRKKENSKLEKDREVFEDQGTPIQEDQNKQVVYDIIDPREMRKNKNQNNTTPTPIKKDKESAFFQPQSFFNSPPPPDLFSDTSSHNTNGYKNYPESNYQRSNQYQPPHSTKKTPIQTSSVTKPLNSNMVTVPSGGGAGTVGFKIPNHLYEKPKINNSNDYHANQQNPATTKSMSSLHQTNPREKDNETYHIKLNLNEMNLKKANKPANTKSIPKSNTGNNYNHDTYDSTLSLNNFEEEDGYHAGEEPGVMQVSLQDLLDRDSFVSSRSNQSSGQQTYGNPTSDHQPSQKPEIQKTETYKPNNQIVQNALNNNLEYQKKNYRFMNDLK